MDTKENPTVAIIGGGFGGMCAAIQLEKQLGITTYTIFDENSDFGGTWLVNSYPGCAVDIQSHFYSYSFELNPNWTQNYASQPEIYEYAVRVAKKYGLYKKARFGTKVTALEWIDGEGQWRVTISDKKTTHILTFDYVISAGGPLRIPHVPEEFLKFTGKVVHSAEYDPETDLDGKMVAVVGSGASAIQIIPTIAPKVKELHCYQRRAHWVEPRTQFDFPAYIKTIFTICPFVMWLFRCLIFFFTEIFFGVFKLNSTLNYLGTIQAKSHLKKQIPLDENLREKFLPNFKLGCKRILVSNNYYETFTKSHVHLHSQPIEKVAGNSIQVVDGTTNKFDVLILATGFKFQDFFHPMKITAKNKIDLLTKWREEAPQTFYGIMTSDMPNAFIILGPNTALGHSSVIFMLECQVHFIVQVMRETLKRKARIVSVKKKAEADWMAEIGREMSKTVWGTEKCGNWYTDAKGRITALWPKNCLAYYRETKNVDFTKMEFSYQ